MEISKGTRNNIIYSSWVGLYYEYKTVNSETDLWDVMLVRNVMLLRLNQAGTVSICNLSPLAFCISTFQSSELILPEIIWWDVIIVPSPEECRVFVWQSEIDLIASFWQIRRYRVPSCHYWALPSICYLRSRGLPVFQSGYPCVRIPNRMSDDNCQAFWPIIFITEVRECSASDNLVELVRPPRALSHCFVVFWLLWQSALTDWLKIWQSLHSIWKEPTGGNSMVLTEIMYLQGPDIGLLAINTVFILPIFIKFST